jgi:hypothetical protein
VLTGPVLTGPVLTGSPIPRSSPQRHRPRRYLPGASFPHVYDHHGDVIGTASLISQADETAHHLAGVLSRREHLAHDPRGHDAAQAI